MDPMQDPIVAIQISMAKMEGMLTQALQDLGQRTQSNSISIETERNRVTELANTVSQHTITLDNQRGDIVEIKEKMNNNMPRTMLVVMGILSFIGIVLGVVNMMGV